MHGHENFYYLCTDIRSNYWKDAYIMNTRKKYLAPLLREHHVDMERLFLASDNFGSSQNEDVTETDYDW